MAGQGTPAWAVPDAGGDSSKATVVQPGSADLLAMGGWWPRDGAALRSLPLAALQRRSQENRRATPYLQRVERILRATWGLQASQEFLEMALSSFAVDLLAPALG